MPKVLTTGEQMVSFLTKQAAERQRLIDEAESLMQQAGQIEATVFRPLNQDPSTFLNGAKSKGTNAKATGGARAKKGEQFDAILGALKANKGKITTSQAHKLFEDRGFRTSANAVLMRMSKKGLIVNAARGEWTRKPVAKK